MNDNDKQSIYKLPYEIRCARAKNVRTPKEDLVLLAKDTYWFVRYYAATNTNMPIDCLLELLQDNDFRIRDKVKRNTTYQSWLNNHKFIDRLDSKIQKIENNKMCYKEQSITKEPEMERSS